LKPIDELETVKTVARMAASVCQNIRAEMVTPALKDGREPVTVADYAAQAVIGHALAANFPDDAVLSEERSEEFMLLLNDRQRALVQRFVTDALGGYVFEEQVCAWLDFGKGKRGPRTWVIDPIDGTKGFIGGRHYCVAISLMEESEPILGVLASPGFYSDADTPKEDPGALIYARRGLGAFIEPLSGGLRQPIHVSDVADPLLATLLTSYESAHVDMDLIEAVSAWLGRKSGAPRRALDSQDKYGMVAAGLGDVYLRVVPDPHYTEKPWDHATGYVIVTEAGGRVTDLDGAPIRWATGRRLTANRGLLVSNGVLHERWLRAIEQVGAA